MYRFVSFTFYNHPCSLLLCSVNNITSLKDFAYCTIHLVDYNVLEILRNLLTDQNKHPPSPLPPSHKEHCGMS